MSLELHEIRSMPARSIDHIVYQCREEVIVALKTEVKEHVWSLCAKNQTVHGYALMIGETLDFVSPLGVANTTPYNLNRKQEHFCPDEMVKRIR